MVVRETVVDDPQQLLSLLGKRGWFRHSSEGIALAKIVPSFGFHPSADLL